MAGVPRVVALGGGHGLAATLSAARRYAGDLAAIVSVADDGGSSGRLRQAFGIPAPGDLRRCLSALADPQSPWAAAFEHRFEGGDLDGHAFGNIVIAALAESTGDFELALAEAGRLLDARGRVIPATKGAVVLKAEVRAADGNGAADIVGQVNVQESSGIARVGLVPADPEPPQAALDALAVADQVVIGPGSLFTSVLAVVAVPAIRDALQTTPARKVYVCNLRPQHPETAGYDVAAHVDALRAHGLDVDIVLWDPGSGLGRGLTDRPCVERPLANADGTAHDPARLAAALSDLVG